MAKILILGKQRQFRTLLSESLLFDGYLVESVSDTGMLWSHLGHTLPDLVLLDTYLDGFATMKLSQDVKQEFPDLSVMTYEYRIYSDLERIKGAVADALAKHATPLPDHMPGPRQTAR